MALRQLQDMRHDDETLYDLAKGMPRDWEPPEYPQGLSFQISEEDLAKAAAEDGEPGDTMRFSAMGEVTSIFKGIDNCRIELKLTQFAGEDGQFFDLDDGGPAAWLGAPSICLCGPELEKLGLEADCERGDMLHLIGTARLDSSSSTEHGGDMHTLQIVEMTCEDESEESRDG